MNSKQRFVSGIVSLIGSIAIFIPVFLGRHGNQKMSFSFSCFAVIFLALGVWQIVYSYKMKNYIKKTTKL